GPSAPQERAQHPQKDDAGPIDKGDQQGSGGPTRPAPPPPAMDTATAGGRAPTPGSATGTTVAQADTAGVGRPPGATGRKEPQDRSWGLAAMCARATAWWTRPQATHTNTLDIGDLGPGERQQQPQTPGAPRAVRRPAPDRT